jgi:hypothetical protein
LEWFTDNFEQAIGFLYSNLLLLFQPAPSLDVGIAYCSVDKWQERVFFSIFIRVDYRQISQLAFWFSSLVTDPKNGIW